MLALGLIFLLSLLPAQNAQPAQRSGPASTARMEQMLRDRQMQGGVCYAIRSYIFKRDDDRAPVLVATTTCTPTKPLMKNATAPKARVVPAVIH